VTIRDITDHADIAYATFFRHYKSKDEIILRQVDESLGELQKLIPELRGRFYLHTGMLLFEHMQQNHEFYRRLFESASFGKQLRLRLAENTLMRSRQRLPADSTPFVPVEIVANHLAASLLALMEWWLTNRQPYSPQRMAEIYDQLIIRPSHSLLGIEVPPPMDEIAAP
jgi:AcrR family transcriptional regulator